MDMLAGYLHSFLSAVTPYVEQYGCGAVFCCVLLEGFGLPLPGEIVLVAASALAGSGKLNIGAVLLAAWLGAVLGNTIGYGIGRRFGRRLLQERGRSIGVGRERLAKLERFFDRYGGLVVVFARYVAILRQINGILAGSGNLSVRRFLIYNAVGASLWVGSWGGAAYWCGGRRRYVLAAIEGNELRFLLAVVVVCLAVVWLRRRRIKGQVDS